MSQSFSFPPPPPPPPKREAPSAPVLQGSFGSRANPRGNYSRGATQPPRGRGPHIHQNPQRGGRGGFVQRPFAPAPKRDFATAFTTQPHNRPRASPAVPSFDIDIKSLLGKKPPVAHIETTKRKSNLLGLTPTDQDASESEDDADDEAKLAAVATSEGLQFEHRGQKLSLSSPAEIAAWIAERRKRYPTQAKAELAKREAEAKKKQWEEMKRARDEAQKQKKDARKQERAKECNERERQRLKEKAIAAQIAKAKSAVAETKDDVATKTKLKVEKLRKKAQKAAKELQLVEEQILRLGQTEAHPDDKIATDVGHDVESENEIDASSGFDSETSSSGSSALDTDSDAEPEESTSRRTAPDRVLPPQNQTLQKNSTDDPPLCKNLTKYGRCNYGKKCRFSHKLRKGTSDKSSTTSGRRKGLYQIMLEMEQEEELRHALRAIIALGQNGLLEDPATR